MIRELIINSGSTSTKLAVFEDGRDVFSKTVSYSEKQIAECGGLYEQIPMRKQAVIDFLKEAGYQMGDFDAIMCRGGMVWGIHMGGYRVNDELRKSARRTPRIWQASSARNSPTSQAPEWKHTSTMP